MLRDGVDGNGILIWEVERMLQRKTLNMEPKTLIIRLRHNVQQVKNALSSRRTSSTINAK